MLTWGSGKVDADQNGDQDDDDDDEAADDDPVWMVSAIAVDPAGPLFFTDPRRSQDCKLTPEGNVAVVAGSGQSGYADGPVDQANFRGPTGIAIDFDGGIYVADDSPRIRKITPDGQVIRFTGTYKSDRDGAC